LLILRLLLLKSKDWYQRSVPVLLWASVIVLVLFVFWLNADLEIIAVYSPHDDEWFLRAARVGYWLGSEDYSQMSFIKEPVFPLFVAFCSRLGIPLRLGTQTLYLAAAGFLGWSLVRKQSRPEVGLVVFAVCAIHPFSFFVLERALYDSIYISLFMITLGALLVHFKMTAEPGRWRRGLFSGLALGLLWNTRPERQLLFLVVLFFVMASAFVEYRRHSTRRLAFRKWFAHWSWPVATCVLITTAIMAANLARWGIFSITAQDAPGFNAAYGALLRIEQKRPIHRVTVNREARQLAYSLSPSFRELEPILDNTDAWWFAWSRQVFNQTPSDEIVTGWFQWGLREAANEAGYHRSGPKSEEFYFRIAAELNKAAAEGRLPTRTVFPFLLDPNVDSYSHVLLPSWNKLWSTCFSLELDQYPSGCRNEPDAPVALFDQVANRRAIGVAPRFQSRIRQWLSQAYAQNIQAAMVVGLLCAFCVAIVRRKTPGTPMYLFTAAVFVFAGLTRLAAFTLLEASAFGANDPRYLFPAALALTVATFWLIAEGARLLTIRELRAASDTYKPTAAPVEIDLDSKAPVGVS